VHALQLGISDGGVNDDNGAGTWAKRDERVERRCVLGAISRRLDDDVAAGADTLLEGAIILDCRVARTQG